MNEPLKFYKGNETSLPEEVEASSIYHCTDTGNTYLGTNIFATSIGRAKIDNEIIQSGEIFNDYENNSASGTNSHAEGCSTNAASAYQHVQGKYNIIDSTDTYAHIIGNGTADLTRSNAHTVTWNGDAWYSGGMSFDGTLVITNNVYGSDLPDSGVEGQIFFLVID